MSNKKDAIVSVLDERYAPITGFRPPGQILYLKNANGTFTKVRVKYAQSSIEYDEYEKTVNIKLDLDACDD